MPVEVGVYYSIVAVPEDYVGNRMVLQQVDELNIIEINVTLDDGKHNLFVYY